jgi:biotin carboxyl carrier protein
VIEVEPGIYSVLWNGRSFEVKIASNGDPMIVDVHGARIPVEIVDPRTRRGAAAVRGGEDRQAILAPMPGKVVRVLVNAGDEVEAGQGAVVVEAMKMQNEMKVQKSGRVVSVSAVEGAAVSAGEVLVVIE